MTKNNIAYKNIILDIGGVLVSYDEENVARNLFSNDVSFINSLVKIKNESSSWKIHMSNLVKGKISEIEFISTISHEFKLDFEKFKLLFEHSTDSIEIFPYSNQFISDLIKNEYKIYILSNTIKQHYLKICELLPDLCKTHGIMLSYNVGLEKPDPEIFLKLKSNFKINFKESIFLDDDVKNIKQATLLGLSSIHFNKDEIKNIYNILNIPY